MIAALLGHAIGPVLRLLWSAFVAVFGSLSNAISLTIHHVSYALRYSSLLHALLGCLFSTSVYVGLLYIWSGLPRDHPATIKRRLLSVLLACCVSWLPLYLALPKQQLHDQAGPVPLHTALGLRLSNSLPCATYTAAHVAVLFMCPLIQKLWEEGAPMLAAAAAWAQGLLQAFSSGSRAAVRGALARPFADEHLWVWRNLVVAPLSEEFVFRACMAPLLLLAGCSQLATVFVTPLFFGAAHLHHLHDLITYQDLPLGSALIIVSVQYAYTSMFGWYATWLFLRSGSLAAPLVAHVLCNWLGAPNFVKMASFFGLKTLVLLTTLSIAGFTWLLGPFTQPQLLGGPLRVV